MIKPELQDKNQMFMRRLIATTEVDGQEVAISLSGATTLIEYRGRIVKYDINAMIEEAVKVIDEAEDKEDAE